MMDRVLVADFFQVGQLLGAGEGHQVSNRLKAQACCLCYQPIGLYETVAMVEVADHDIRGLAHQGCIQGQGVTVVLSTNAMEVKLLLKMPLSDVNGHDPYALAGMRRLLDDVQSGRKRTPVHKPRKKSSPKKRRGLKRRRLRPMIKGIVR
ncbi:MAG: hypothetical protein WEA04_03740 [Candidatus Andersenbacteria bacterium]